MIIGRLKDLLRGSGGEWVISFTTKQNPVETFYLLKDHDVSIDMRKYSKKRSLNANAYAWVLIDKIAEVMKIKPVEVYKEAINGIGGISISTGMKTDAIPFSARYGARIISDDASK